MQKKRNIWLLTLMSSSVLLLLVLQFFWIRSEYRSAEESFRRETNLVFKSTVSTLLDSLYMSRIDLMHDDSIIFKKKRFRTPPHGNNLGLESLGKALKLHLITKDSTDTIRHAFKTQRVEGVKSFMIRINPDSLDINNIKSKFADNLQELDKKVVFQVLEKEADSVNHTDTAYVTEFIRIGPPTARQYAASFEGVPLLLFQEIYPQIIFSLILTLMIAVAFTVMYRSLRAQQRLSMQKDDFISNVSHELKTPIATVNVALEAFKNFKVLDNPKMTDEYLDIVKIELNRLSQMTEKILNTSVYENLGIKVENEVIDINHIVNQLVISEKLIRNTADISIEPELVGSNFTVKGSKIHITNMLHNLLDNAIKYSQPPAGIIVKIIEEQKHIVLKVKDNGMGIPEEYQHKIFDKFFRVPHGDIHNVKGYGLGLSYVSQVVKAHKGTIEVDSELGHGSTFTIKLPKNG